MASRKYVGIGLIGVVLTAFFIYRNHAAPLSSEKLQEVRAKPKRNRYDVQRLNEVLRNPQDKTTLKIVEADPCLDTVKELAEITGNEILTLYLADPDKIRHCLNENSLKSVHIPDSKQLEKCAEKPDDSECLTTISKLQMLIAGRLGQGQNNSDLSTSLLIFKLQSSLFDLGNSNMHDVYQTVKELNERDPSLGFFETQLILQSMLARSDPTTKDQYVEDLKEYAKDFPQEAMHIELTDAMFRENLSELGEELDEFVNNFPENPEGHYFRAILALRNGNSELGRSEFEKAATIKGRDDNPFYEHQWKLYQENPKDWQPSWEVMSVKIPDIDPATSVISKF